MSKLRDFAKGKPCTFRLSESCSGEWGEDTVLAHAPSEGKGMGMKSPDSFAGILCYNCHILADSYGNSEGISRAEVNEAWLKAIYETQEMMIRDGLMVVPEDANKSRNRRRRIN